jgi:hypothetical protein
VTCVCHANSTGEIEQFRAIVCVNVCAFSTVCNKIENATPGGSHVGEIFLIESVHDFLSKGDTVIRIS